MVSFPPLTGIPLGRVLDLWQVEVLGQLVLNNRLDLGLRLPVGVFRKERSGVGLALLNMSRIGLLLLATAILDFNVGIG